MLDAFRLREFSLGRSKILEHFAVQHVVFPAVAAGLALHPGAMVSRISGSAATQPTRFQHLLATPTAHQAAGALPADVLDALLTAAGR